MKKIKSNPVKTVLTISMGFLLIYIVTKAKWAIGISFFVGIAGMLSDYISRKIEFVWMKITWLLGLIVPNILLSAIFYLFLFPIALLAKLFGKKDPLMLKKTSDSAYITVNKAFDKTSLENPW